MEDFRLDVTVRKVECHGEQVRLIPTEWKVVGLLVRNPGQFVGKQKLMGVWGPACAKEVQSSIYASST